MIEKRQFETGRRITVSEIATATGLNRMTLSKILNQQGYSPATDPIERLCTLLGCQVDDLLEHIPETNAVE
eukprot:gene7866-10021_t